MRRVRWGDEDEEEWGMGMRLTESLVRTKLSTSIERVAPSLAFSSATFLGRAIMIEWVVVGVRVDDFGRVGSLKKPERRRLKEYFWCSRAGLGAP